MFRTIGCIIKLVILLIVLLAAAVFVVSEYWDEIVQEVKDKVELTIEEQIHKEVAQVKDSFTKEKFFNILETKIYELKNTDNFNFEESLSKIKNEVSKITKDKLISKDELNNFTEKLKSYGK